MKGIDIDDILNHPPPTALDTRVRGGILRPVPDEQVYPGLFDTDRMNRCYLIFMQGGSFDDCVVTTGANARTVARWAQSGGWLKARDEIERSAAEEERQRLDMKRREQRIPELEKQIRAGQMLRERVAETLESDGNLSPANLKMLGDALKSAGDNTVRALGVSESGSTAREDDAETKKGKAPLVVLIQGGGLPPVRMAEVANADGVDKGGDVIEATPPDGV